MTSLILALAACLAAAATQPAGDQVLELDRFMERLLPRVQAVEPAALKLHPLIVAHASGADPDSHPEREGLRRDLESETEALDLALTQYWDVAEAARAAKGLDFIAKAVSGQPADASIAATAFEPPAYPKVAKTVYREALALLAVEEEAYQAARARRDAERRGRTLWGLSGLVAGCAAGMAVFAAARR